MSPWRSVLFFLDSGRVSDEFEPSLRKTMRTDILVLLAIGTVLMIVGVVVLLVLALPLVALVLLLVGAGIVAVAAILWTRLGRRANIH